MTSSTRVWIAAALGAVCLAALCVLVFGNPKADDASPAPEYRTGEVLSVDPANDELTLREGLGPRVHDVRVLVRPATRITHAGVELPLDDVKPGDHATVHIVPGPAPGVTPITVIAREIRLARAGDPDDGSDDDSDGGEPP